MEVADNIQVGTDNNNTFLISTGDHFIEMSYTFERKYGIRTEKIHVVPDVSNITLSDGTRCRIFDKAHQEYTAELRREIGTVAVHEYQEMLRRYPSLRDLPDASDKH